MKFLLVTIFIFSQTSLAQMNNWSLEKETKEQARNYREYQQLQLKYPGMLRNEDSRRFKQAVLHLVHFKFTGETICQENDSRLKFRGHGVTVCYKNNSCYATAPLHPYGDEDPCLE